MSTTLRVLSVAVGCVILAGTEFYISAQQTSFNRLIHVVVTEPANRVITGLARENFEIVENGIPRPITYFDADSPVSIAIVGVTPPDIARLKLPEDELILTPSLPDAIRELVASKNARKAIILTAAADTQGVPDGIQVLKADEANLPKTVIEIHNEYLLGFSSSDPSSVVNVTLREVTDLPPLKVTKK
jgi:hypothetical protein